jgi:hypothetical protein
MGNNQRRRLERRHEQRRPRKRRRHDLPRCCVCELVDACRAIICSAHDGKPMEITPLCEQCF